MTKTELELLDLILEFIKRYYQVTITFYVDGVEKEVSFRGNQTRYKNIFTMRENLHRCYLNSGYIMIEGFVGGLLTRKIRFISDGEKFTRFK